MRSALLYYRKHHGVVGARVAMAEEVLWHRLRAWRNGRRTDPRAAPKPKNRAPSWR